jgi:putative oxidoreductase
MFLRLFHKLRTALRGAADKVGFLAPALIRVTVAPTFIISGWGKLHSLGDVTGLFTELHIPFPAFNAVLASSTELFGGLLLLVGLGARLVSLPLAFTMLVAIVTAKLGDVTGLISFLELDEWRYLVMFMVIALIGPGALSLDALLARLFSGPAALPRPRLAPRNSAAPALDATRA